MDMLKDKGEKSALSLIMEKVTEDIMERVRKDFIKEKRSKSTEMNAAEVTDSYASKMYYISSQDGMDKSRGSRNFKQSRVDQSSEVTNSKLKYESQVQNSQNRTLLINNLKRDKRGFTAQNRRNKEEQDKIKLEFQPNDEQYSSHERVQDKKLNDLSREFAAKEETDAFSPNLYREELVRYSILSVTNCALDPI